MPPETTPQPQPKIEPREIASLVLHPGHAIFAEPEEHEVATLAADIERRGLQQAVEITPEGEVIAGRKRLLALAKLGRTKIHCRVRYDLVEAGDAAIMAQLLGDNLLRHHLTPLERARAYVHMCTVAKDGPRSAATGDLRDLLAKHFGKSGRHLSRLARALKTPRPVQDALDRGELTILEVQSVASLRPDQQADLAAAIVAGMAPKTALAKFVRPKPPKSSKPAQRKLTSNSLLGELTIAASKLLEIGGEKVPNKTQVGLLDQLLERLAQLRDDWVRRQ